MLNAEGRCARVPVAIPGRFLSYAGRRPSRQPPDIRQLPAPSICRLVRRRVRNGSPPRRSAHQRSPMEWGVRRRRAELTSPLAEQPGGTGLRRTVSRPSATPLFCNDYCGLPAGWPTPWFGTPLLSCPDEQQAHLLAVWRGAENSLVAVYLDHPWQSPRSYLQAEELMGRCAGAGGNLLSEPWRDISLRSARRQRRTDQLVTANVELLGADPAPRVELSGKHAWCDRPCVWGRRPEIRMSYVEVEACTPNWLRCSASGPGPGDGESCLRQGRPPE